MFAASSESAQYTCVSFTWSIGRSIDMIAATAGFVEPALVARLPFALLLVLTLALTWYTTFHLARTEAALPVPFAFGGEAHYPC
jgi:hypothetical protein